MMMILLILCCAIGAFGDACSSVSFRGQFRKDFYLPNAIYPEYNQPDPVQGGRIHLVATVPSLGTLSSVQIHGQELLNLTTTNVTSPTLEFFDWGKALYFPATAQLWISFHSQNTAWLGGTPNPDTLPALPISVRGSLSCVTGSWVPVLQPLAITWATPLLEEPANDGREWVVHVHNYDNASAATVSALWFDGQPAASLVPSLPLRLGPLEHAVFTLQSPTPKARGQLFTVGVDSDQGAAVGNGARVPEARFPVEVWPRSSDCPVPGVNHTSWSLISSHGIDTVFYSGGTFKSSCQPKSTSASPLADLLNAMPPPQQRQQQQRQRQGEGEGEGEGQSPPFYVWTDSATAQRVDAAHAPLVSAVFLADEDDGEMNSCLRTTLAQAVAVQQQLPSMLSYQGGKTNRHDGAYAGITDIQGMDFYVAACAPTIIPVTKTLPLQASFAYLRNTRNNQMPLPSMTYSQLYGPWSYQPNANEIIVQMGSVYLAGAKGITMFQSIDQYFQSNAGAWDGPLSSALLTLTHPLVRSVARTGDVQSLPLVSSDQGDPILSISSLTQAIRNDRYIMIVAVSTDASGYSNLLCHIDISTHWEFKNHTIASLTLTLTPDVDVASVDPGALQEVSGGSVGPAQGVTASLSGSRVTISSLALPASVPLRVLLLPYNRTG